MSKSTAVAVAHECKHATYIPSLINNDDVVVVKEKIHYSDGRTENKLRLIENYKREFFITRPNFRNHYEKKEWEQISKLERRESTQANLQISILRALGKPPVKKSGMRRLFRDPYIYGCDVSTPTLIKHYYMHKTNSEGKKWMDYTSPNLISVFDSETDIDTGEMLMLGLTMKERAVIAVQRKFLRNVSNPIEAIQKAFVKYLSDMVDADGKHRNLIEERKLKLEVILVDKPWECVTQIFERAHAWQPDILAAWNIDFDLPKILETLAAGNIDPADVLCDPSIPLKYRYWQYKQGLAQKVTASGKTMALQPAERWHRLTVPATWYLLDPMCVYYRMRIAGGKDPSYGLDAILNKELGLRKLKFAEADGLIGADWHRKMQQDHPVEYCVYNLFDCISVEMLDEKTTDLSLQITSLCGHSEFHQFSSQPSRLWDDINFMARERGLIVATTSDKMEHELDEHVTGLKDWIVTLDSHLVKADGLKVVEENPEFATMFRGHVADLDVEGTYPNEEVLMNISKETTYMELAEITGVTDTMRRAAGINLTGGFVNAAEICRDVMGAPHLHELLHAFREERQAAPTITVEATASVIESVGVTAVSLEEFEVRELETA